MNYPQQEMGGNIIEKKKKRLKYVIELLEKDLFMQSVKSLGHLCHNR